jgi:hypothetical protein
MIEADAPELGFDGMVSDEASGGRNLPGPQCGRFRSTAEADDPSRLGLLLRARRGALRAVARDGGTAAARRPAV